jgi:hypothetical protein
MCPTTSRRTCGKPTTTKSAKLSVRCDAAPVELKGYECAVVY